MTDFAKGILEAAGAVPDGRGPRGWGALADRLSEGIILAVKPFRLFLKCSADVGGVRPGEGFFEMFLGHGKAGAIALLDAYQDALSDDPAAAQARKREWWALAETARKARAAGLIDWTLDTWKPAQADPSRTKIGFYLPLETAERLRVAAFQSKATISGFIEGAIVAALDRLEQEQGAAITPRAEAASGAAGRRRTVATAAS